jgi:hypothetical protein
VPGGQADQPLLQVPASKSTCLLREGRLKYTYQIVFPGFVRTDGFM